MRLADGSVGSCAGILHRSQSGQALGSSSGRLLAGVCHVSNNSRMRGGARQQLGSSHRYLLASSSTCLCVVNLLWSRHRHEAGTAEAAHEPEGGVRVVDGRRQLLLGHPLVLRHPRLLRLQQRGQPVCDALRCNTQPNRFMSSCSWSTASAGPASAESATIASNAAHALGSCKRGHDSNNMVLQTMLAACKYRRVGHQTL